MTKQSKLKGAPHVHTSLSYDGTMSLEEISSFFKKKKFDFVLITEHSENISNSVMNKLTDECKRFSSSKFLIIPGLEFRCRNDLHILGLGVNKTLESDDPLKVINYISQQGGVAILAHPTKRNYAWDKVWIEKLDGAEIWNVACDGKFLPQVESIRMFKKLAEHNPCLKPFAGMDLHRDKNYYDVSLRIERKDLNQDKILKDLKEGNFTLESTFFKMKPGIGISRTSFVVMYAFRKVLNLVRKLRDVLSVGQKEQDLTYN
jgi:predicted metal-dependent phosphoesterase TrpH